MRFMTRVALLAATGLMLLPPAASALTVAPSDWSIQYSDSPIVSDEREAALASMLGSPWSAARRGGNSLQFGSLRDGDFVVLCDVSSPTGHTGLFDGRYYIGLSSYAMWSANIRPSNGVQREQCAKYRMYDRAIGLRVPRQSGRGRDVCLFAARQAGKPYRLSSKTDLSSYYCSKLVWASYRYVTGIDLDANGGAYVLPSDLLRSRHVEIVGIWT